MVCVCPSFRKAFPFMRNAWGDGRVNARVSNGVGTKVRRRRCVKYGWTRVRGFPSGGNVCRSGVPKWVAFPVNSPKLYQFVKFLLAIHIAQRINSLWELYNIDSSGFCDVAETNINEITNNIFEYLKFGMT